MRIWARCAGECFGNWCDLVKARQMQAVIDALIAHTVDCLTEVHASTDKMDCALSRPLAADGHVAQRLSLFALNLAAKLFCRGKPFAEVFVPKSELLELAASATKIQQMEMQHSFLQEKLTALHNAHSLAVEQIGAAMRHVQTHLDTRLKHQTTEVGDSVRCLLGENSNLVELVLVDILRSRLPTELTM